MKLRSATALGLGLGASIGTFAAADDHVAPYHVAWLSGFEVAIPAYNEAFSDIDITGRWLSAEGSPEPMIQQNEVTINEGPNIMFVNAINIDAFEPLVAPAQGAGITSIAVHSPMDSADYSSTLRDVTNGRNQGMARHAGTLEGISTCDNVEVVAEQPADWDTVRAQAIAENWMTQFRDLNAISGVTDANMYPSLAIAANGGRTDLQLYDYDGDIPISEEVVRGQVMADILLSGSRDGWNFVQRGYRIHQGEELEQVYDFFTSLVLTEENHQIAPANGFPKDVEVYDIDQALDVAANGYLEIGPDSVQ